MQVRRPHPSTLSWFKAQSIYLHVRINDMNQLESPVEVTFTMSILKYFQKTVSSPPALTEARAEKSSTSATESESCTDDNHATATG